MFLARRREIFLPPFKVSVAMQKSASVGSSHLPVYFSLIHILQYPNWTAFALSLPSGFGSVRFLKMISVIPQP